MSTTTYKYKANNEESYQHLAMYVITLPVTVSLFPKYLTIAVPECASKEVGEYIDNEALDFTISVAQIEVDDINELIVDPTVDVEILRDIAISFQETQKASAEQYRKNINDLTVERDKIKKDRDFYSEYWTKANADNRRIKEQVKAISVLVGSIFPED